MANRFEKAMIALSLMGMAACRPSPETVAGDVVLAAAEQSGCKVKSITVDDEASILPLRAVVDGALSCKQDVTVDDLLSVDAFNLEKSNGFVRTSEGDCMVIASANVDPDEVHIGFMVDCLSR